MPLVPVNGVALYYETAGAGAPVVLVHGFACGIRSWDPQVRSLSRSRRIITYDVRGHGISEAPREPAAYSEAISVEDLHGLLVSLGIHRVAVGGLSMGGGIALNFAIAHPEMVTRLILADTGAGSDGRDQWLAGVHALAETLEQRGMEPFADMACASPLFARYIAQGPAAERFIRSCLMTHRAHGLAHTAREALAKRPTIYALEPRLRQLQVPTLLLVGEHDEPCVMVHRFMADCIQGSEHIVVSDSGHLTNLEAPAAFDEAVNRFLARSYSTPSPDRRSE